MIRFGRAFGHLIHNHAGKHADKNACVHTNYGLCTIPKKHDLEMWDSICWMFLKRCQEDLIWCQPEILPKRMRWFSEDQNIPWQAVKRNSSKSKYVWWDRKTQMKLFFSPGIWYLEYLFGEVFHVAVTPQSWTMKWNWWNSEICDEEATWKSSTKCIYSKTF